MVQLGGYLSFGLTSLLNPKILWNLIPMSIVNAIPKLVRTD